MENLQVLSEEQEQSLHQCLSISRKNVMRIEDSEEAAKFQALEDKFPSAAQFFRRIVDENGKVEYKTERLKVSIPIKKGNYFLTTLSSGEVVSLR